jgi:hypothetical protein
VTAAQGLAGLEISAWITGAAAAAAAVTAIGTAPISSLQGGRRYRVPREFALLVFFFGGILIERYVYCLPCVQLQQFRKKKERRGPGKKADADADAEAEEGASKAAEESVPEPKSPVGLKLLAGEGSGGGGGSTPFEVRLDHFSVRLWVLSGLLLLLLFLDVVAGCVMPVCQ